MNKYLDESVVLSSMSPTINKCLKKSNKKITKLALKKELRRSSVYDKLPHTGYGDVLLSASDTTETISTSSGSSRNCTKNLQQNITPTIEPTKSNYIEKWVEKVNLENNLCNDLLENIDTNNVSVFSELSTIFGENNKARNTLNVSNAHFAFNSTFVKDRNCFRFDEMFHKKNGESLDDFDKLVYNINNIDANVNCKEENEKGNNNQNPKNESIVVVSDSFEENECAETPVKTKNEIEDHEKLLDELYGNSWRVNKEKILTPVSEPKQKRKVKIKKDKDIPKTERKPKQSITHKNPYLMSERNKSEKLLRTLHTARLQMMIESPFIDRLKTICDTDSSVENLNVESPLKCNIKLDFSDSDDEDNSKLVGENLRCDQFINMTRRNRAKYKNKNEKFRNNVCDSEPKNGVAEKLDNKLVDDIVQSEKIPTREENTSKGIDSCDRKTNCNSSKVLDELFDDAINNVKTNKKLTSTNCKKDSKTDSSNSPSPGPTSNNHLTTTTKEKNITSNVNNLQKGINKSKTEKQSNLNAINKRHKKNNKKRIGKHVDSSSDDDSNDDYLIIKQSTTNCSMKQPKKLSFLASLSDNIPIDKCDNSARIYRNTYKINKEELAKKLFSLYNKEIFNNKIPDDALLEWNDRMRGTAGFCYCRKITRSTGAIERSVRIVLATKILDSADRLRDTLVHEMCHAATWIVNEVKDGHGKFWKAWATKAMKTFPELPPITRCHDYVINTKYTYKCVGCGYSIGRHSKSLDVERKRCGHCYGKFEVFINKTTKNGIKAVTPVTPKQATGFALFVKENYSNVKKENMNHANVMKVLSKKFNELKTK